MEVSQTFQMFRVRVWKCSRTHRSSGYCGTGLHKSQKFRAGTKHAVPAPRVLWDGSYRTHRNSGYGYESLHNFQKFSVLWHRHTELTGVPGGYDNAVPVPRVSVALTYRTYRSSGYGYEYPSKLAEVPGTGKNPGKHMASGEEFDLKWTIPSSLHGMPSLGQRPRGNPA